MADTAAESWWIKVGVLYDKSGFKGVVAGMLDINKAAGAVYDTFKKVVDAGSDMYNTARYLNVSTGDLQKWQRAFAYVTDSAEGATDAISSLNFIYDKLRLGMDDKAAEFGARLGLSPEDYLSFDRMLTALNKSYNELFKSDYGAFKTLAEQLGLSKDAILVVTQSTKEFQNTLRRAESIPLIPEHQIKAARELKKQFTDLSIRWENFKASVISSSFPAISKLFKDIEKILTNPETKKGVEELFASLEKGFSDLVNNIDIKKLIEDLSTVSQAALQFAKYVGPALSGAVRTTQNVGSGWGTKIANLTRDKAWEEAHARNQTKFLMQGASVNPVTSPVAGSPIVNNTVYQNISVSGDQSARSIANQITDAGKQAFGKGNSNMQQVDLLGIYTGRGYGGN